MFAMRIPCLLLSVGWASQCIVQVVMTPFYMIMIWKGMELLYLDVYQSAVRHNFLSKDLDFLSLVIAVMHFSTKMGNKFLQI